MDRFNSRLLDNPSEGKIFSALNRPFNDLKLNASANVGSVANMVRCGDFHSKEEWAAAYFFSGTMTARSRALLAKKYQERRASVDEVKVLMDLQRNSGRSRKELGVLGVKLHSYVMENPDKYPDAHGATLKQCQYAVYYMVICTTWNGIALRERNTIEMLKQAMPGAEFRLSTPEEDAGGVDYIALVDGTAVCGLQIKPVSYMKRENAQTARNAALHSLFEAEHGYPVVTVYSRESGTVISTTRGPLNEFVETLKSVQAPKRGV